MAKPKFTLRLGYKNNAGESPVILTYRGEGEPDFMRKATGIFCKKSFLINNIISDPDLHPKIRKERQEVLDVMLNRIRKIIKNLKEEEGIIQPGWRLVDQRYGELYDAKLNKTEEAIQAPLKATQLPPPMESAKSLGLVITMPKNEAIGICDFRYVIKSKIDQTENIHGNSMKMFLSCYENMLDQANGLGNMNMSILSAVKTLEKISRRYSPSGTGISLDEHYFEFWYGEIFDLIEELSRLGFFVINYSVDDFDEISFYE